MLPAAERPTVLAAFRNLIPGLAPEARAQLEADIVAHGCREPLVVWRGFLADGHNRLEICERRGVPYATVDYSESPLLPDEGAVVRWICENQLCRRNLEGWDKDCLIGKLYVEEKKDRTQNLRMGNRPRSLTSEGSEETAARIGRRFGVSRAKVERCAQLALALDVFGERAGIEVRDAVMHGAAKCSQRTFIDAVAVEPPSDLDGLRNAVDVVRSSRRRRTVTPTMKPAAFFQRAIKEFIRDDSGKITAVRLAVCGHVQPYKARSGAASGAKTKSCRKCGSGSRPAFERFRRRVQLEAVVRVALKDSTRFQALCDFVDAGVSVLSIAPMTERMRETWARLDRAAIQGQLVDAPTEAEAR